MKLGESRNIPRPQISSFARTPSALEGEVSLCILRVDREVGLANSVNVSGLLPQKVSLATGDICI